MSDVGTKNATPPFLQKFQTLNLDYNQRLREEAAAVPRPVVGWRHRLCWRAILWLARGLR